MNILDYLLNHLKKENISFHMPGHKGSGIFKMYGYDEMIENIVNVDITEISGADNLHKPEGIIKDLEDRYANLYSSKKSFLLINGSTTGILASIMATVPRGKKILVARNCHKSVYSGTILAGITPVYVMPAQDDTVEITGPILAKNIDSILSKDIENAIEAVILPSPNYYGICSDIKSISQVVHKYGKILIVDQAHGAHLKFFENIDTYNNDFVMPRSAESTGADIVINSTHKTLASFTQSGVLNIMSNKVDVEAVFEKLQLIQSTSPSYILMMSLAMNCDIIEKNRDIIFSKWIDDIKYFYSEAEKINELEIVKMENLDLTKINLSLEKIGVSGEEFEKELLDKGIDVELVTGNILMAMTGIGNTKKDYDRLLQAIYDIVQSKKKIFEGIKLEYDGKDKDSKRNNKPCVLKSRREREIGNERGKAIRIPDIPRFVGIDGKTKEIALKDAIGCTSRDIIAPYPPGIPFVCPGEEITEEAVEILSKLLREKRDIIGISSEETIRIIDYVE